ncbi:DNA-binding transcriptional regulator, MerR family [Nonomuraea maritima]|uniref:DNA-binding transcriptional regulator, MerR family n=1 Tax=Nonomuraea maritima TaxID=683260 RepID=A0A1G9RMS2_9ACTN|nr:MerR family transcriptional regulator [Nonomuraea maritima]SDM24543.1 DNA-binding transcriptional regulator, MerR family [Nonomuraea maritima]
MRIAELSRRTSVSPRLLRYYEEQELLKPSREQNGYRDYDEVLVGRVRQIRDLLDSGLSTKLIKDVLPCLAEPRGDIHFDNPEPEFIERLVEHCDRLTERIDVMTRNRDALRNYLERLASAADAPPRDP